MVYTGDRIPLPTHSLLTYLFNFGYYIKKCKKKNDLYKLTLKNLRGGGVKMTPLRFFWNNSRKK